MSDRSRPIVVNGVSPNRLKVATTVANARIGRVDLTNLTAAANEDFATAVRAVSRVRRETEAAGGRIVMSVDDLDAEPGHDDEFVPGIIVGFQNAAPLEHDLENLEALYLLGLRVLQLTYQHRNLLADGCGEAHDGGLSRYGRRVVAESNRLGILVDLGHVGERSSREAIDASDRPCVISHANLTSRNDHVRNKSDELIRHLADHGGVFGVTAIARLIRPDGRQHGADMADFVDQIEAVCELVGADHVGIGLDIVEDLSPEEFELRQRTFFAQFPELEGGAFPLEHYYTRGISSSRDVPAIAEALADRGFGDDDISRIMGGNFVRVLREAWHG